MEKIVSKKNRVQESQATKDDDKEAKPMVTHTAVRSVRVGCPVNVPWTGGLTGQWDKPGQ